MKKFWLIALAALTIVGCARRPAQPQEEEQPQEEPELVEEVTIDNPYTDFTAVTPEGEELSLSQLVGKTDFVLVDFWASWCGPCRAEMPNVKAAYEKYKSRGFEIVGVSFDNNKAAWQKAVTDLGITWPQMSDLKGWQCAASAAYNIKAIPATILFDPEGRVVCTDLRGKEIESKLSELLK